MVRCDYIRFLLYLIDHIFSHFSERSLEFLNHYIQSFDFFICFSQIGVYQMPFLYSYPQFLYLILILLFLSWVCFNMLLFLLFNSWIFFFLKQYSSLQGYNLLFQSLNDKLLFFQMRFMKRILLNCSLEGNFYSLNLFLMMGFQYLYLLKQH